MQTQLCCALLRPPVLRNDENLLRAIREWAVSDPSALQLVFDALRHLCHLQGHDVCNETLDIAFGFGLAALCAQRAPRFGSAWTLFQQQGSRFAHVVDTRSLIRPGAIFLVGTLCGELVLAFVNHCGTYESILRELSRFRKFHPTFAAWLSRCRRVVFTVLDTIVSDAALPNAPVESGVVRGALCSLFSESTTASSPTTGVVVLDPSVQSALRHQCATELARLDDFLTSLALNPPGGVPNLMLGVIPFSVSISEIVRKDWSHIQESLDFVGLAAADLTIKEAEAFLTPVVLQPSRVPRARSISTPNAGGEGVDDDNVVRIRQAHWRPWKKSMQAEEQTVPQRRHTCHCIKTALNCLEEELMGPMLKAHDYLSDLRQSVGHQRIVDLSKSMRLLVHLHDSFCQDGMRDGRNAVEHYMTSSALLFKLHAETVERHIDTLLSLMKEDLLLGNTITDAVLVPFSVVLPRMIHALGSCQSSECELSQFGVHESLIDLYDSLPLESMRILVLKAQFVPSLVTQSAIDFFEDCYLVQVSPMQVRLSDAVLLVTADGMVLCGEYIEIPPILEKSLLQRQIKLLQMAPTYRECLQGRIGPNPGVEEIIDS